MKGVLRRRATSASAADVTPLGDAGWSRKGGRPHEHRAVLLGGESLEHALGAEFVEGEPWASNVVVDRSLYTGQNPASSGPLAERMLEALSA